MYHNHDRYEKAEGVGRDEQIMVTLVFYLACFLPALGKFIIRSVAYWFVGSLESLNRIPKELHESGIFDQFYY